MIDAQSIWSDLQAIRKSSPLIHNITNYVVMEQTANALLAIGASPIMAHAQDEIKEVVALAQGLVLNIGTVSRLWLEAMHEALEVAYARGIPIILDPVGSGATQYRTNSSIVLLKQGKISVIRGNGSEIVSLLGVHSETKGVDSLLDSSSVMNEAKQLALQHRLIVWMSGVTDLVTDGSGCFLINNGDPLMARVTGMGCTATALTAAFLAVNRNSLLASAHAACLMGICGELAARASVGPGTFKMRFQDALYNVSLHDLENNMKMSFHA